MKTLREYIKEAGERGVAIGHFNISNLEGFWGIIRAARALAVPVIIGVSEGERDFIGVRQAAALVASVRAESSLPIFLNADHTYSFDRVKEAIDAGYDAVIFDGSKLPMEENMAVTKRCVDYARTSGHGVLVEGEIGYIGTSSKILDALPTGVSLEEKNLPTPEAAAQFVRETGVDLLAPAVGNIHGMFKVGGDPALHLDLIRRVREAARVPLVLHGASGNTDADIQGAIKSGAAIVHVNTEIRVAYRDALKQSLQENPEEVAPYKILRPAMQAVERVVSQKLKLFNFHHAD
ncbi:MAG: class II fructose-bisphosphate aldolase [Patescibacteria group bacterium]